MKRSIVVISAALLLSSARLLAAPELSPDEQRMVDWIDAHAVAGVAQSFASLPSVET